MCEILTLFIGMAEELGGGGGLGGRHSVWRVWRVWRVAGPTWSEDRVTPPQIPLD